VADHRGKRRVIPVADKSQKIAQGRDSRSEKLRASPFIPLEKAGEEGGGRGKREGHPAAYASRAWTGATGEFRHE